MTADTRRLARNVSVDVSSDGSTWLNLPARVDNAPQITPNKVDSTDVDTDGFTSAEITLQSGVLTCKYNSLINGGTPSPAQELVEACIGEFGDDARLHVRYYDNDGGTRGFSALAIVEVSYSKTGVADLREVQVTFTLDGTITKLSPSDITTALAAADLPVVVSALPTAVAVANLLTIVGTGFASVTGAAGVKVGGTNVTHYTIVSDSVIVAVMPAGSAGSAVVLVTNPTGASNSLAYTRGA